MTVPEIATSLRVCRDTVRDRVRRLGLRGDLVSGVFRVGTDFDAEIVERFEDGQSINQIAREIRIGHGSVVQRVRALGLQRPMDTHPARHRQRVKVARSVLSAAQRRSAERRALFGLRSPRRAVERLENDCRRDAWPVLVPALFNSGLTLAEIEKATGATPAVSVHLIRAEAHLPCA
ncbi:hypothetical protein SB2_25485 [Methylobacterium radiotolerans]|nr:hypothetical protein SB3_28210 [Methylobacterium radiotolerans]KTS44092.1 hypothetical protein SB2_25485 [Methylobacterium radiotolerans]